VQSAADGGDHHGTPRGTVNRHGRGRAGNRVAKRCPKSRRCCDPIPHGSDDAERKHCSTPPGMPRSVPQKYRGGREPGEHGPAVRNVFRMRATLRGRTVRSIRRELGTQASGESSVGKIDKTLRQLTLVLSKAGFSPAERR